jgi:uncharacterized membrane protein HdeD (DUF308 family)
MSAAGPAAAPDLSRLFGELQKNWGWLLALGILFVILGTIGLGMTFALTLASVLVFGILIGIGGVVQLLHAFTCRGWTSVLGHVLIGVLYIVAGIAIVEDPVVASLVFTLLIAGAILAVGVVRLVMAFQMRGTRGWVWMLVGGVVAILLGLMIAVRWPVSAFWVIGLFVAIDMLFNGWSYIFVALAARDARGASGGAAA